MTAPGTKPRILVSNDDGISAPGIKALISALLKANIADIYVCAPAGERSAQSQAITLGRYMSVVAHDVPGAAAGWAVDGTPADSVMLALNSPLLGEPPLELDLMVSGINRGDNCGLHILYSGTVGAAREAACKGLPAIAFSLDNHMARKVEDYAVSSSLAVSIIKAALGLLPGQDPAAPPRAAFNGAVINVNFPIAQGQLLQGLHLTHQSSACVFPAFRQIKEPSGQHLAEIDEHTPNTKVFRNFAGEVVTDDTEGGDAWAVKNGWVSVTPLGLRQDVLAPHHGAVAQAANGTHAGPTKAVIAATAAIIEAAAADNGVAVGGLSKL